MGTYDWHIGIHPTLRGPGTPEPDSCTRLAGSNTAPPPPINSSTF